MKARRQRSDRRHGRIRWTQDKMDLLNRMLGALVLLAVCSLAAFTAGAPAQAAPTTAAGAVTSVAGEPTRAVEAPTVVTPTLRATPPQAAVTGTVTVEAPLQSVGTPTQTVGTLTQTVGAPTQTVGAPTQTVGAPTQTVGAPTQVVGTPTAPGNATAPVVTATLPPRAAVDPGAPSLSVEAASPGQPSAAPVSLPGTAHLAIQVSDSVASVGGTATSKVFVSLRDVRPGGYGFHLHLRFDPRVVQVEDADGDASNGTQVALSPFAPGTHRVTENRVDNRAGQILITVLHQGDTPRSGGPAWHKVATLTWTGHSEGNSAVVVDEASHFVAPGGQRLPPDAAHGGTVFARSPPRIEGAVRLQGRDESRRALVACLLAATRVDKARVAPDGRFALTVSHGEGFYTLKAFAPGYLSAEGDRPLKLTVGSVLDLGEVSLYAGDVNGDDRIDVRDLSYVAWRLNTDDAGADLNGDGQVDFLDLSLAAENLGRIGPSRWEMPAARATA